jgi:hypothetical protein
MRLLRWVVELAVNDDARKERVGISVLRALVNARIVVSGDRAFLKAVARAVSVDPHGDSAYLPRETYVFGSTPGEGGHA